VTATGASTATPPLAWRGSGSTGHVREPAEYLQAALVRREGRREAGEDAHPADGRGEAEPQADGRLVTVYDAKPAPRRPHDVIAPPGGRPGSRPLRSGPKALAKWLAGFVRKDPADMIIAAFDEAGARDPGRLRTWVVLVDGAEHQLALVRAEAGRGGVTMHVIIDIIHVLEYIWGAA
jgi:hypothetical protein